MIFYGIIVAVTSKNTGIVNILLGSLGLKQQNFLTEKGWWLFIYVVSGIWKETGWQAILYLSALSGVDQQLYEAAAIDGAGRFKRLWHITLPGIRSTIVVILILEIGKIMTIGFEKPITTAAGLFRSVINFALVMGADRIAKLMGEPGLFGGYGHEIRKRCFACV